MDTGSEYGLGSYVEVRFERTDPGSEWKLGSVRRFYVWNFMFDSEGNVTLGRLVLGSGYRDLRSCWHPPTRRLEVWCLEVCGQRPGETAVVITSRKQTSGPAIAGKRRDTEEKTGFASRNASATHFSSCCFFLHASQADSKTFFRLTVSYFQGSFLFFFFFFFFFFFLFFGSRSLSAIISIFHS